MQSRLSLILEQNVQDVRLRYFPSRDLLLQRFDLLVVPFKRSHHLQTVFLECFD